ncbi:ATP-binding protein [Maribacter sp. 2210JD10-5]|uniref:ATP-binding protein n=1 Tax=Maribacter sp. 2210JD10-5 TaxID=3386272 RepID=UPI0039BC9C6C
MSDLQNTDEKWPKTITVDKRIVGILSVSTYKNFPRALKEIITNSYDADAHEVSIKVDIEKEVIIITDNGKGMNAVDFGFYLRIAGKDRKKNSNTTDLGRKIIGQFGVGFLSVFPFFKNYKIESSKAGSDKVLHAEIPLAKYFDMSTSSLDVGSISINGGERIDVSKKTVSYTRIELNGFNDLTKSFFHTSNKKNNYDIETYPGLEKLKWILEDDLPLRFKQEKFNQVFNYEEQPSFDVYLNGEKLYRGVYGTEILETHKNDYNEIGNIKFKYFISTPRKSVFPHNGKYLKIRNLNVGVGDERDDFSERRGGSRSRIHWLTGEVHILDGMNNLIRVSRDDFNYSRDYEDLKDFFNERLQHFSNRLELESSLKKEISQTGKEFRVRDVNLLNPEYLKRKVEKFENEGFEVMQHKDIKSNNVIINEELKEISIDEDLSAFEKHILIEGNRYLVKSESWDYEKEFFPACKLVSNVVIINSQYPLFKGLKYTDVFIKIHLLMLMNFRQKVISEDAFTKLTKDVLKYYHDY